MHLYRTKPLLASIRWAALFVFAISVATANAQDGAPTLDNPTAPSSPQLSPHNGTYRGVITQAAERYETVITLNDCTSNTRCGTIEYPSLNCGGYLTYRGFANGAYNFLETLTRSTGCLAGWITLEEVSTFSYRYRWLYSQGGSQGAVGNLTWSPPYKITGTIVDPNGLPMAGVAVSMNGAPTVVTTSAGTYEFLVDIGTYTIWPSKWGYRFIPESQRVTAPPSRFDMNFQGVVSLSFTGRVRDLTTGAAMPGVTVTDGAGHMTTTDSNGGFAFTNLPAGTYTLTPSKPGYGFSPPNLTLQASASGIDFRGFQAQAIEGRVTDGVERGVPGVTIRGSSATGYVWTAVTDASGAYSAPTVPAGAYQLTANRPEYSFTPASRSVTVPPKATGQDFVQRYALSGWASDLNGNPLVDVDIRVDGTSRGKTATDGRFLIIDMPAGQSTVTAFKSGAVWSRPEYRVTLPPNAPGLAFVGAFPGQPIIRKVTQCILGQFFIRGASAPSDFVAEVDWQGHEPSAVRFTLNGNTSPVPAGTTVTRKLYDLGRDLKYGFLPVRNELEVVAVNKEGVASAPYLITGLYGVEPPAWFPSTPGYNVRGCGTSTGEIRYALKAPVPPFKAQVEVPASAAPIIGGSVLGIPSTQGSLELSLSTDGSGSGKISGITGFEAGGVKLEGALYGGGQASIERSGGIRLDELTLGLAVGGVVTKKWSVGSIPGMRDLERLPVVGGMIRQVNDMGYVSVALEPEVSAETLWDVSAAGWSGKGVTGGADLHIRGAGGVQAIPNGLEVEAYVAGGGGVTLQVPAQPSHVKEVAADVSIGVALTMLGWQHRLEGQWPWKYTPGGAELATLYNLETAGDEALRWTPIPRTYLAEDPAAGHPAPNPDGTGALSASPRSDSTTVSLLASNIFPYPQPALAISGTLALLLTVHDDPARPPMQGYEIRYAVRSGEDWQWPGNITNDDLVDLAPEVVFDALGHAVAVWQRQRTVQTADSNLTADYTRGFELAYAVWDGVTWSAPAYLTDNTALDDQIHLSRGRDGAVYLLWRQNDAGELIGGPGFPDRLNLARWEGTSWTFLPALSVPSTACTFGMSLAAYNAKSATVAYVGDNDNNAATSSDRELYSAQWSLNSWTQPVRLTTDQNAEGSPFVFYRDGQTTASVLDVAETANPTMLALRYFSNARQPSSLATFQLRGTTIPACTSVHALHEAPYDNVALLWPGTLGTAGSPMLAYFSISHLQLGPARQLVDTPHVDRDLAPAMASDLTVWLAYAETHAITPTAELREPTGADSPAPQQQTDLVLLHHKRSYDLALGNLRLTAYPGPGQSTYVSVGVTNLGDYALSGLRIRFYPGNPDGALQPFCSLYTGMIANDGAPNEVNCLWVTPLDKASTQVCAVVESVSGLTPETNRANNTACAVLLQPDLRMVSVWSAPAGRPDVIDLSAFIQNNGIATATPATVVFRLDDPVNGPVLGQTQLPAVPSGGTVEATTPWTVGSTAAGPHRFYASIDPQSLVEDGNRANNTLDAALALAPDVAIGPADLASSFAQDLVRLTVTVTNGGSLPAHGVRISLYPADPRQHPAPSPRVVSPAIDLAPGQSQAVDLTWPGDWWPGFYVQANVTGEPAEPNLTNNLALFGRRPWPAFIPMIVSGRME